MRPTWYRSIRRASRILTTRLEAHEMPVLVLTRALPRIRKIGMPTAGLGVAIKVSASLPLRLGSGSVYVLGPISLTERDCDD
jgi:hypothetical protein